MKKSLLTIVSVIVALSLLFCSCSIAKNVNKKKGPSTTITRATTKPKTTTALTTTEATTTTNPADVGKDLELEKIIKDSIPDKNGEWAVYYKNLKDDKAVTINSKRMVSASLIKLFIMGTVYSKINSGELKRTNEIDNLLEKMITISHNDSSNTLVEIAGGGDFKYGMSQVNNYAMMLECLDTEQQRNMLDSRPKPIKEQNYTSVKDCGVLLEKMYKGELVSKEYDKEMLDLMLHQQRTWKIPAGLPKGTKVANKTGELSDTENDVAIVFTDKADYILCVMSNNVNSVGNAQNSISKISTVVYDYVQNNY